MHDYIHAYTRKQNQIKHYNMKFAEYKNLNLPQTAEEVLQLWDAEDTFRKSISTREGHPAFVFY